MSIDKPTEVADILTQNADTYRRKNQDYGSSWKAIGYAIWELANHQPIVLDSPEKIIAFGLFTRRFDKMARSMNGEFFVDDLNFESAADSDEDESVYAAMQAENKYDQMRKVTLSKGSKSDPHTLEEIESFSLDSIAQQLNETTKTVNLTPNYGKKTGRTTKGRGSKR